MGADTCSAIPEIGKEKTITLLVENGRVTKTFDKQGNIKQTIEYYNTKNALRNIKGIYNFLKTYKYFFGGTFYGAKVR